MKAQEGWDKATHAYSRYPSTENWQTFLECKEKVLRLQELLEQPSPASVKYLGINIISI